MENKDIKKDNQNSFMEQFNLEFGAKLKQAGNETPILINLLHNYIEQTVKINKVHEEIVDQILLIEDELKGSFNERQKELFDKWEIYSDGLKNYTVEQAFIYGYCIYKQLSIEAAAKCAKIKIEDYNQEIIEKLYKSDIVTDMETTQEHKNLLHQYNKLYESIEDTELKNQFSKLEELKNQIYSENDKMIFKKGFSMATQIVTEALNSKNIK